MTTNEIQETAERLQSFIRDHSSGGCKMFSKGEACLCPLCDVARLVAIKELRKLLIEQAKLCLTPNGGGLLLSIKAHLEGRELYSGCEELWQVADHLVTQRDV